MNTNQALIALLWDKDKHGEPAINTGYTCRYCYDGDISDALVSALTEESDDVVRSEDGICGHYADGREIEIYWWDTNASREWSADRPDWWDARGQVEAADAE